MRTACLSAFIVAAAACAAHRTPAEPAGHIVPASTYLAKDGTILGGTGPQGKFVCDFETPLGSHVSQKVCRYVDDTDESTTHRQQTQEALRTHPVCAAGDSAKCMNNARP